MRKRGISDLEWVDREGWRKCENIKNLYIIKIIIIIIIIIIINYAASYCIIRFSSSLWSLLHSLFAFLLGQNIRLDP
jgi:hypothetical protein